MKQKLTLIIIILNGLLISQLSFAKVQKLDFESKYPAYCFEIIGKETPKDDSRECRVSRLNFYMDYLSREPANANKGNFNKVYSMIKMRTSIENAWSN
jgi:hypothetical protein